MEEEGKEFMNPLIKIEVKNAIKTLLFAAAVIMIAAGALAFMEEVFYGRINWLWRQHNHYGARSPGANQSFSRAISQSICGMANAAMNVTRACS